MSESVAVVLIVWASVIIPHVIEYFVWRKRFDAQFNDDREERSQHSCNCTDSERTTTADETETWACECVGGQLTVHVMECTACGGTYEHVNGGYEFCPRCGRRLEVGE